jgi:protein-tyrosine phosphatase
MSLNSWIADNYGSRRGFVRSWWCRIRNLLGGYRTYRKVDWGSIERLVFVCKGNICRSAYAGALARSLGFESVSCGLDTRFGLPADEHAIRAASLRGVDLKTHRTTPIQDLVLGKNDLLVVMEPWQVEHLKEKYGNDYEYTLLGLWGRPESPHIHDPYGRSSSYYNHCFNYIDASVHEILRKISETN